MVIIHNNNKSNPSDSQKRKKIRMFKGGVEIELEEKFKPFQPLVGIERFVFKQYSGMKTYHIAESLKDLGSFEFVKPDKL